MVKMILKSVERSARLVTLMWWVFFIDVILNYTSAGTFSFTQFGLQPRTAYGLAGIFTMPLLHGNIYHLVANTITLMMVLPLLYLHFPPKDVNLTVFKIVISSGILLWLFGRGEAIHIGASALGYGLMSYTAVIGFVRKQPALIAYSLTLVLFCGGSVLVGVLPLDPRISWDGHLMGAIAGIVVASSQGGDYVRSLEGSGRKNRKDQEVIGTTGEDTGVS